MSSRQRTLDRGPAAAPAPSAQQGAWATQQPDTMPNDEIKTNTSDPIEVAILAALPKELGGLWGCFENSQRFDFCGQKFQVGYFGRVRTLIGTLGFGKVNAAVTVAALAQRVTLTQVWHAGCAGAYSGVPLNAGDVLISTRMKCGDEGGMTADGVFSTRELGFPILTMDGEATYDEILPDPQIMAWVRNETPAGTYWKMKSRSPQAARFQDHEETQQASAAAHPATAGGKTSFQLVYGPSVTVSMVSGDAETAGLRFRTYRAFGENMEGSAVAQACCRLGVPMLECRGISNVVGERRKEYWQLDLALDHCHSILLRWLSKLASQKPK